LKILEFLTILDSAINVKQILEARCSGSYNAATPSWVLAIMQEHLSELISVVLVFISETTALLWTRDAADRW